MNVSVSAVGGLTSDRLFIEPNRLGSQSPVIRPGSQTPAIQVTGATLVLAKSVCSGKMMVKD